jgi:hypothetical protein
MVFDDATIGFAGIDLDSKPDRPEKGYTFDDARKFSDLMDQHGIPHTIARSTTNGYHMYIFFERDYLAAKWRAIANWLFETAGFMEQMRLGVRPLPECFPKQSYVTHMGIGNGLKCAPIESGWERERNGFVDKDDKFYPADQQWVHLASVPYCSTEHLDSIIESYGLEVEEVQVVEQSSRAGGTSSHLGRSYTGKTGKWQPPLSGSFEKVVEGCAALNKVMARCKSGAPPNHNEGFALWHMALHCADGIEYFKTNVPGWGENDKDVRQLNYSVDRNYSPHTCSKLQEQGICVKGTKCFDKKPPLELVEGHYIVKDDIPESQWADPSPLRFAFGKGEDFLEKLKKEVDEVSKEEDENKKGNTLREIAKRAQVFDEDQQRVLRDYVRKKKILRAPELTKIFHKAGEEKTKETKERAATRSDTLAVGENLYQLACPYGYSIFRRSKANQVFVPLCNFTISIEEIRSYLDSNRVAKTVYIGTFKSERVERPFEIDVKQWVDNNEFMEYFSTLAETSFNILRSEVDYVRQAALGFSEKAHPIKTNKLITQGWYQGTFLMPGIQIDKDGVRPNTEKEVDLTGKMHAEFLEFKMIDDSLFRDVLFHIKTDLLNCWPRQWTFLGMGHVFFPALMGPLGISTRPALFYEGLTGSGKTALCHLLQYFWGQFESLANLTSTSKGIYALAYEFKDCLLVLDDYKGLDHSQISALGTTIQYSYEPTARFRCRNDSSLARPSVPRCALIFTGESFISNDAAMVSRTIMVEVDKQNTVATRDLYERCREMRQHYCGVTPRFIHWFLLQDVNLVKKELNEIKLEMLKRWPGVQNAERVAHNLGTNHMLWRLWVRFLLDNGVCCPLECDELINEHWAYACEIQTKMVGRCKEEQNSLVFLHTLVQLITSNSVVIDGLNLDDDTKNRPLVGYVIDLPTGRRALNILPELAVKAVKDCARHSEIRGTTREFGRQFFDMGYIADRDHDRFQLQVSYKGGRVYVWCFDMEKIGIVGGGLSVVREQPAPRQTSLPPLHMDPQDGTY